MGAVVIALRRDEREVITREQWIGGLRRHAESLHIVLTSDMLDAANSIYDAIEVLKNSGFTESDAWRELVDILDHVEAGDVSLSLELASRSADLLERLQNVEDVPTANYRETLRKIIEQSIEDAHDIARIGLRSKVASPVK